MANDSYINIEDRDEEIANNQGESESNNLKIV